MSGMTFCESTISVIVPVYNAEAYLRACLDSILSQTYARLEILLVDDGSTDASGRICDAYAKQDARVRVIHKPNGGESSARNAGVTAASGDYIGFVDSDDTILPQMFERMAEEAIQTESEIVICGHFYCELNGWVHAADAPCKTGALDRESALFYLLQGGSYEGYVWNKLFKRELFDGIQFDETIFYCEDLLTVGRLMQRARNIYYLPELFYNYYIREDGLTETYTKKRLTEFDARERIVSLMQSEDARLQEYAKASYCKAAIYQLRCAARAGDSNCMQVLRGYAGKYWRDYWRNRDVTARDKLKSALIWRAPRLSDRLWRGMKPKLRITYNRQANWSGGSGHER